eukprot:4526506-Pyramimonas_sp.AAC.1
MDSRVSDEMSLVQNTTAEDNTGPVIGCASCAGSARAARISRQQQRMKTQAPGSQRKQGWERGAGTVRKRGRNVDATAAVM